MGKNAPAKIKQHLKLICETQKLLNKYLEAIKEDLQDIIEHFAMINNIKRKQKSEWEKAYKEVCKLKD